MRTELIRTKKHHDVLIDLINANQSTKMAEIGVWKASSLRWILYNCQNILKEYWAVDPWDLLGPEHGHLHFRTKDSWDSLYENACKFMLRYPQLRVLRMTSERAAGIFPKRYFDLVYIDASHFYEDVKYDISIWMPLIRKGGIISGHDYMSLRPEHQSVTIAVDEMLGKENVQTITNSGPDVWYKRI